MHKPKLRREKKRNLCFPWLFFSHGPRGHGCAMMCLVQGSACAAHWRQARDLLEWSWIGVAHTALTSTNHDCQVQADKVLSK